jgi:hypothetical protein
MTSAQIFGWLGAVVYWEVLLFLTGLFGIIAFQLLTGRINTRNLLYGTKRNGEKYFSPERIQLLVLTLAAALVYLRSVLISRHTGQFPPIPKGMLQLLGSSNGVYLAGKSLMSLTIPGLNNSSGAKGS